MRHPVRIPLLAVIGLAAAPLHAQLSDRSPDRAVGSVGRVTFTYRGARVTYPTVRAEDGKIWLLKSLGSGRVATSTDDEDAYGDLFQWGRWDDGHQVREPANTRRYPFLRRENDPRTHPVNPAQLRVANQPVPFLYGGVQSWWPGGQSSDTWDRASGDSATATAGIDPCRAVGPGWRLPTMKEFQGVLATAQVTNADGAFQSALKLSVVPPRSHMNGSVERNAGAYWTSTAMKGYGAAYPFGAEPTDRGFILDDRGSGFAVRCLLADESARPPAGATTAAVPTPSVASPRRVYRTGTEFGDVTLTARATPAFDGSTPVEIKAAGGFLLVELPAATGSTATGLRPFGVLWYPLDQYGQKAQGALPGSGQPVTGRDRTGALSTRFLGNGRWMFSAPASPNGVLWVIRPRGYVPSAGNSSIVIEYNPVP